MIDLSKLSNYKENNRLEAKRAQGGLPHSIWETYSAFANSYGGFILLGVIEQADKSFASVPLASPESLVSDFWNSVNNRSIVNINILSDKNVQILESGGNRIVVIEVPRADRHDRPVYVGNDPFSGSYRRNGEGDYHCTGEEVRNMMRDQSDVSQDSRILSEMDESIFDTDSVQRYRNRMNAVRPGHVWQELDVSDFLHRIGAMARDSKGVLHPTSAGLLMFGHEYDIVREFPNYFLDYQEIGDASTRWVDRIISTSGDWSGNIFDFYFRVYNRIAESIRTPFVLDGTERVDDTPVHLALREALANALLHADYHDRRGLVIQKLPDSLRISNPGAFRVDIREALLGGISDPRNATMIKMFNLIGIGERAGSGIPNIHAVWQQQGWPAPMFTESFNPDRTTLQLSMKKPAVKAGDKKSAIKPGDKKPAVKSTPKAEQNLQRILQYLTDHVEAGTSEIADSVGLSVSQTRLYLGRLVAEDAVIATDGNRNRKYRLKS